MSDQFEIVPRPNGNEDSFTFVDVVVEEEEAEVDGFVLTGGIQLSVDNSLTLDNRSNIIKAHDSVDRKVSRAQNCVSHHISQAPYLVVEGGITKDHVWKLSLAALILLLLCYDSVLRRDTVRSQPTVSRGSSSYDDAGWPRSGLDLEHRFWFERQSTEEDACNYTENWNYPSPNKDFLEDISQGSFQLTKGPVSVPRFLPVKMSREISILTPCKVHSAVVGAPQPSHYRGITWQKQPAFIPVRSFIPFAAPRPSPASNTQGKDTIGTQSHRLIPVPSKRRGIVTDLTPTLNVTADIATNVKRPMLSYLNDVAGPPVKGSTPQTKSTTTKVSVVLTQSSFDDFLREYNRSFVIFYYPCSSYERLLVPAWTKFTSIVMGPFAKQGDFQTGTLDCLAYPNVCNQQGIFRFPTLRWFENGQAVFGDYKGRRTVAKLLTYALVRLYKDDEMEGRMLETVDQALNPVPVSNVNTQSS